MTEVISNNKPNISADRMGRIAFPAYEGADRIAKSLNSKMLAGETPEEIYKAMESALCSARECKEQGTRFGEIDIIIGVSNFINQNKSDLARIGLQEQYDTVTAKIKEAPSGLEEAKAFFDGLSAEAKAKEENGDLLSALVTRMCCDEAYAKLEDEKICKLIQDSSKSNLLNALLDALKDPDISEALGIDVSELANRQLTADKSVRSEYSIAENLSLQIITEEQLRQAIQQSSPEEKKAIEQKLSEIIRNHADKSTPAERAKQHLDSLPYNSHVDDGQLAGSAYTMPQGWWNSSK